MRWPAGTERRSGFMTQHAESVDDEDRPWASKRVLVCGSRTWNDDQIIDVIMSGLSAEYAPLVILHGAAPGADSIAEESAHVDQVRGRNVDVVPFPAKWDQHGRAAGPIRNQEMLDDGKPDWVIAFTDDLAASKGTRDMVRRAHKAGVPVYVVGRYTGTRSDGSACGPVGSIAPADPHKTRFDNNQP